MNNAMFVRSHVERCLQDAWGVCHLETDGDGDYPFHVGSAACYVRVDPDGALVRVFAVAVNGVRSTGKLLAEINDINVRSRTAYVILADDQVLVTQTVAPEGCSAETLEQACDAVSTVANDVGGMIAAVFGGSTPFSVKEEVTTAGEID